ncbi:MAG: flippase activity-associated protein Agl23 [Actinomycetota bacterium]
MRDRAAAWVPPLEIRRVYALPAWSADVLPYAGIFVAALVLRVVDLQNRPLHHDESSHAWLSWLFLTGKGYHYDPAFHGPLQFYVGALMYLLAGVGDTAMRLGPALVGAAITFLPFFLRRQLGSVATLAASAILCISPSYLYYSRFSREDIYFAFLTLAFVVVLLRFLDEPQRWHPSAMLALLAASFATKETTYITAFVVVTFVAATVVWQLLQGRRVGQPAAAAPVVRTLRSVGWDAWISGVASFAFIYTLLFTTFLFRPEGLRSGIYDGLRYWLSQQPVNRGGQPWFYYLFLLPLYELPVLVLAVIGVVVSLRRPTLLRLFLVWDAALSLVVYSWASERMPWLGLHVLLPLVLLAGIGAHTVWAARGRPARVSVLAGAALGAVVLGYGAVQVVYVHPADPAEPLVFTQTSEQFAPIRDRLDLLIRRVRAGGRQPTIYVDDWGGTGWPWNWYLRDSLVRYGDMSTGLPIRADAVIVDDLNRGRVQAALRGYRGERFHLREWWVIDYGSISPGTLWRWYLHREPWSPQGYVDQWLYVPARG